MKGIQSRRMNSSIVWEVCSRRIHPAMRVLPRMNRATKNHLEVGTVDPRTSHLASNEEVWKALPYATSAPGSIIAAELLQLLQEPIRFSQETCQQLVCS